MQAKWSRNTDFRYMMSQTLTIPLIQPFGNEDILYWLEKGKTELTIMRNGAPNSQKTTYTQQQQMMAFPILFTIN